MLRPPNKTRKVQAMSKIKNTKQFKEQVDAAFATMQTRDEADARRGEGVRERA